MRLYRGLLGGAVDLAGAVWSMVLPASSDGWIWPLVLSGRGRRVAMVEGVLLVHIFTVAVAAPCGTIALNLH